MELNGLSNIYVSLLEMRIKSENGNKLDSKDFEKIEKEIFLFKDYLLYAINNKNAMDWSEFKKRKL